MSGLSKYLRTKARKLRNRISGVPSAYPGGHFYSPVTDPSELEAREEELWPRRPTPCMDVAFNDPSHRAVLTEWFPRHIGDFDYPENPGEPGTYFTGNPMFSWLDARALFVFLLELKPRRMIEIGSGFSSLLVADINRRFMDGGLEFSCIEPYPQDFLKNGVPGMANLHQARVESLEPDYFTCLEAGDFLFIDSSHVSKTGSDVNFIFFEILPRLKPGVIVHLHDIYLPSEYPKKWALTENRSWNEQYLLRALLMNSSAWEVIFGCHYAYLEHRQAVAVALGCDDDREISGSSFWMRKTT